MFSSRRFFSQQVFQLFFCQALRGVEVEMKNIFISSINGDEVR